MQLLQKEQKLGNRLRDCSEEIELKSDVVGFVPSFVRSKFGNKAVLVSTVRNAKQHQKSCCLMTPTKRV